MKKSKLKKMLVALSPIALPTWALANPLGLIAVIVLVVVFVVVLATVVAMFIHAIMSIRPRQTDDPADQSMQINGLVEHWYCETNMNYIVSDIAAFGNGGNDAPALAGARASAQPGGFKIRYGGDMNDAGVEHGVFVFAPIPELPAKPITTTVEGGVATVVIDNISMALTVDLSNTNEVNQKWSATNNMVSGGLEISGWENANPNKVAIIQAQINGGPWLPVHTNYNYTGAGVDYIDPDPPVIGVKLFRVFLPFCQPVASETNSVAP